MLINGEKCIETQRKENMAQEVSICVHGTWVKFEVETLGLTDAFLFLL